MRESISTLDTPKDESKESLAHLEEHIKNCYKSLSAHKGEEDGMIKLLLPMTMHTPSSFSTQRERRFSYNDIQHDVLATILSITNIQAE